MKQFDATINTVYALDDKRLWIVLRGCEPLDGAVPGQFVMFRPCSWDADPLLGRPLSLLSAKEGEAEFLVQMVGRGTRLFHNLQPGAKVSLLGPVGTPFPRPEAPWKTVLVAGGVGLPPLLMWVESCPEEILSQTHLLYGAATETELVFMERLAKAVDRGLDLHITTEDGSKGDEGLVTQPLDSLLQAKKRGKGMKMRVFACGPKPMMSAVAQECHLREVPCWVSLETRMACGRGVCLGCAVEGPGGKVSLVCKDGPVFSAHEVDWQWALNGPQVSSAVAGKEAVADDKPKEGS